jgi:ribosome-binding factor A
MEDSQQPDESRRVGSFALPPASRRGEGGSRPLQVGTLLQRTLQERLVKGLHDPRYRGMVSILEVRVSPDLADAVVFVSVLPAERGPLTLAALQHARGHLAGHLLKATRLRRVPRLQFRLDDRLKKAASLESAIRAGVADAAEEHGAEDDSIPTTPPDPGTDEVRGSAGGDGETST